MKFKYFAAVCAAILYHAVPTTHGQTEWVWGKSSNGNGNAGGGISNYNNYGSNSNSNNNNNNNNHGLSNGGSGNGNGGSISFLGQRPNNQGSNGNGNGNNVGGGSNLVPVHTVTIIGNNGGSGLISGSGGSSSASGDKYFTSQSQSVPANPGQPIIVQVLQPGTSGSSGTSGSDSNSKNNDILPTNSIRSSLPVDGEARLLPHIHKFIRRLVHGQGSNTHSSNGGGGSGGISNLISSGGFGGGNPGIIGSILQIGPQLAQGISNRFPTGPSNNDEFNTQGSSNSGSSSGGSFGSGSLGGGDCTCVPSDQCRLPRIGKGTCTGGIMCCRSSGTRLIGESFNSPSKAPSTRFQPGDIRRGLFGEIVRGTSNILDDTLDFFLAPFLTQEDQQKLANRIAENTRKG